ncbi:NAD+ synthase [Micavibrio aeruginosavorus]|uniref:Glutamine-dependent NAD(+) synthetase n=1 Tax=Micavibrio aeruginosavorus (strain ARL-13) TaxID=856793 RepID=G2KPR8_MICAA|nr:NAD+ synthase [Micavibrio aeruginosavorus]AEP09887.1 NAD+ synthetase [Micavibrio aeruginosavorus ARL-13]
MTAPALEPLHITLAQTNPTVGAVTKNAEKILQYYNDTPDTTDLIVFTELVLAGYSPEDLVLKPAFLASCAAAIEQIAAATAGRRTHILLGAPISSGQPKPYNAALLIGDGKIVETRLKHHLPNYGVFDDERIFTSGPLPDPIAFRGYTLGVMVCEDMWFPDVSANLKQNGAQILIAINGSPFDMGKHEKRRLEAKKRTAETGLPLIYTNQVGGQDAILYDGASFIMNETGDVVAQMDTFAEDRADSIWTITETGKALCQCDHTRHVPDGHERMYGALMLGLRDYVTKNGFPGVVLGLSGGIDSALTAAIATDALGPSAVHTVMLPGPYTAQESLDDATESARLLGIAHQSINIIPMVQAFEKELASNFNVDTPSITFENLQSRSRGVALMALSNATNRMVLTTGNKSEMATGYATLYGDMCGGFNALKDVYKTDVFALSRWRNAHHPAGSFGPHGPVMPERTITRPPTAELRANQTDQDSLPPYDVLDAILFALIEGDQSIAEIVAAGHDVDTVTRVQKLLDRAEYKRRQSAPGTKISRKAFGPDRRYPITNGYTVEKQ